MTRYNTIKAFAGLLLKTTMEALSTTDLRGRRLPNLSISQWWMEFDSVDTYKMDEKDKYSGYMLDPYMARGILIRQSLRR